MTAPKDESVSLVKSWLQNEMPSGKISMTGDYITVEGTVDAIEKLLNTKYSSYSKLMTFILLCTRVSADIHEQSTRRQRHAPCEHWSTVFPLP
jgi:hypothetical protein